MGFISFPSFRMETKKESIDLWKADVWSGAQSENSSPIYPDRCST